MNQSAFWKPKFIVAAFILIVATFALFYGYMSESVFRDLLVMVFGGFCTASVIENKLMK